MTDDYSRWNHTRWSTGIYYINKIGIDKMYNLYYKNGKIDLNNNNVADHGLIYKTLISYNYTKPLFIHTIKESFIHMDHLHGHIYAYNTIVDYFNKII